MGHNGKILLIEDDQFTARMMVLQFEKNGFLVRNASSAEEALDSLNTEPFDIVLSDVSLPGISGLKLVEQIRKKWSKSALPVLLVSGSVGEDKAANALEAGANDYLHKTNEFSLILSRIEPYLALKRLRLQQQGPARTSRDGMWNWSFSKDEVYFSPQWKAILGYGPDELGKDPHEWLSRLHPEDSEAVKGALEAHWQRKTLWFEENYRMVHKLGHALWVHGFGVALFNKDGKPVRMIGSMTATSEPGGNHELGKELQSVAVALDELESSTGLEESARKKYHALVRTLKSLANRASEA